MRWGQRAARREREGRDALEQPLHSGPSHSCSHLAAIHTIPVANYPSHVRSEAPPPPPSRLCAGTQVDAQERQNVSTQPTAFFFLSDEVFFFLIIPPLFYLIKLLSSRAAAATQLGGCRYSKPPRFLGDSALLRVPMRSQGNPIPIFRSCSRTEEQEVQSTA